MVPPLEEEVKYPPKHQSPSAVFAAVYLCKISQRFEETQLASSFVRNPILLVQLQPTAAFHVFADGVAGDFADEFPVGVGFGFHAFDEGIVGFEEVLLVRNSLLSGFRPPALRRAAPFVGSALSGSRIETWWDGRPHLVRSRVRGLGS